MSTPVASLGMYDHPAQRAANDAFWHALAQELDQRGIDAPRDLDRSRSVEAIWRDPDLLLAQCCGYPLVSDDALDLRVIALPVYDVAGCEPGRHSSNIVGRADDPRRSLGDFVGSRAAVNAPNSNSGYNLFRASVAEFAQGGRVFDAVMETGSHRASAEAVRTGTADIAAIDAVTWAAIARFEPDAVAGLRIVARSPSSPSLPFVTARTTSPACVAALRDALAAVAQRPDLSAVRNTLFLREIRPASIHRFVALKHFERAAAARGYATLQ